MSKKTLKINVQLFLIIPLWYWYYLSFAQKLFWLEIPIILHFRWLNEVSFFPFLLRSYIFRMRSVRYFHLFSILCSYLNSFFLSPFHFYIVSFFSANFVSNDFSILFFVHSFSYFFLYFTYIFIFLNSFIVTLCFLFCLCDFLLDSFAHFLYNPLSKDFF